MSLVLWNLIECVVKTLIEWNFQRILFLFLSLSTDIVDTLIRLIESPLFSLEDSIFFVCVFHQRFFCSSNQFIGIMKHTLYGDDDKLPQLISSNKKKNKHFCKCYTFIYQFKYDQTIISNAINALTCKI